MEKSQVDLREMAIFVAVVEHGSFVAASRKLGVPTSTVSRRIASLEARLGAALLHRTTRSVTTTDVGAAYYQRCARIVADAIEADESVRSAHDRPTGRLRISVSVLFAERFLGPVVFEYMRAYRGVDVEVLVTDDPVDLIAGEVDVALRSGRLEDSRLIARKLGPAQIVLCASPAYLERHPRIESVADLAEHDCILRSGRSSRWAFASARGQAVKVSGRFATSSVELARQAAVAGLGIARLPAFLCAEDLRAGALQRVLPGAIERPFSVYAIYVSKQHLAAKIRTFLSFVSEKLQPPPWLIDA